MTFDGKDLRGLSAKAMNQLRGEGIGYIPQEPMSNLDPSFRIGSQLTEPMRHHLGMSAAAAKTAAHWSAGPGRNPGPGKSFRCLPA